MMPSRPPRDRPPQRDDAGRREQLRVGAHPHRSRALQRRVEDGVRARAPPRGPSASAASPPRPDFQHDHRLGARRGAQRRQEAARVVHRLDVEQDAVGGRIEQQRVEQLAEIDVEGIAERDHRGEPDAGRRREIEQRRAHGARLRDQREAAAQRLHRPDRRVEADVGADHAERFGADEADAMLRRRGRDVALPLAAPPPRRPAAW